MVNGVVVLEHIGMCQHGSCYIMQSDRIDVGHVVQLCEVVSPTPLGPAIRVGFRQVQIILRVVQYLVIIHICQSKGDDMFKLKCFRKIHSRLRMYL